MLKIVQVCVSMIGVYYNPLPIIDIFPLNCMYVYMGEQIQIASLLVLMLSSKEQVEKRRRRIIEEM